MATKASKSTALVPWEQEMKALAVKKAAQEHVTGGFKSVSIQSGGIMTIDDERVPDNELECIILCGIHTNLFYTEEYDPNNPAPPACYAYGDPDEDDPAETMAPHEKVEEPENDTCAGCPNNVFGSAEKGRGKACRNVRRLALIPPDALDDELDKVEPFSLQLPVTSVKHWSKYATKLANDMSRPPFGVVTKISSSPDPKNQLRVDFEFVRLIEFDADSWGAIKKKAKEAEQALMRPYPTREEFEEQRAAREPQPKSKNKRAIPIKAGKKF